MIDLHLHLDGSISVKSARELAELSNIDISDLSDSEIKEKMVAPAGADLPIYLSKFDFPLSLLRTKESLSRAVTNLLDEIKDDGILYAEIRFAPQLHAPLTQEEAVVAALEGIRKSTLPANLILCMMRGYSDRTNKETIDIAFKYLNRGVSAVDLAGDEYHFKTSLYTNLFVYAKKLDIPLTIHAGEAAGPDSVEDAIKYAARIGHGVRASENFDTMQKLKELGITLELCPKSNLDTSMYRTLKDYPIRKLMDAGVKVTINTDNMTVSDTSIKNQLQMLEEVFGFTYDEIKEFYINSVKASFASEDLKEYLIKKIENSDCTI